MGLHLLLSRIEEGPEECWNDCDIALQDVLRTSSSASLSLVDVRTIVSAWSSANTWGDEGRNLRVSCSLCVWLNCSYGFRFYVTTICVHVSQICRSVCVRILLLTAGLSRRSFRFLNIRLDNIKVLDEARHPHMVRTSPRFSLNLPTTIYLILDGSEELLHPWISRAICAAPIRACRHTTTRRRDKKRFVHPLVLPILMHADHIRAL